MSKILLSIGFQPSKVVQDFAGPPTVCFPLLNKNNISHCDHVQSASWHTTSSTSQNHPPLVDSRSSGFLIGEIFKKSSQTIVGLHPHEISMNSYKTQVNHHELAVFNVWIPLNHHETTIFLCDCHEQRRLSIGVGIHGRVGCWPLQMATRGAWRMLGKCLAFHMVEASKTHQT